MSLDPAYLEYPRRRHGYDHDLYLWSALHERPPVRWPGGAAVAVWICIGLEYSHAEKFSERWRRIIAAVRAVYHGRISYGANWTDFEKVPFWDAVDEIGVVRGELNRHDPCDVTR